MVIGNYLYFDCFLHNTATVFTNATVTVTTARTPTTAATITVTSVGGSVGRSVNRSVDESVGGSVAVSVGGSVGRSVGGSVGGSVDGSVGGPWRGCGSRKTAFSLSAQMSLHYCSQVKVTTELGHIYNSGNSTVPSVWHLGLPCELLELPYTKWYTHIATHN